MMQRIILMDGKTIDQATREVLIALGEILGKDTKALEQSICSA
jgi:hypothetical protein